MIYFSLSKWVHSNVQELAFLYFLSVLVTCTCRPAQVADLPASEPIVVPELFAPSGTSDNEDEDDYRDRTEYPILPHHPRPAVVCITSMLKRKMQSPKKWIESIV